MTYHTPAGSVPIACTLASHGRCRICEFIDRGGPDYREDMRQLFHPEEFPASQPPGGVAPTEPPRPSVAENLALLKRIKSCPHWSKPGCGCQFGVCALGRGAGGKVNFGDCSPCDQLPK